MGNCAQELVGIYEDFGNGIGRYSKREQHGKYEGRHWQKLFQDSCIGTLS
jgi:hypothetical protein